MTREYDIWSHKKQLGKALLNYYVDMHGRKLYNRWDTWLLSNGYVLEYTITQYMTQLELNNIHRIVITESEKITGSLLWQALTD